jgi:hypothetical protein
MGVTRVGLVYGCALALTIVVVDVAVLRHHFWLRLVVNMAIAATFALSYWFFR